MLKRCMDVAGSALGLVLLSPLFAAVAIGVRLTSAGPIFYRQERVGYRGRRFRIYKFRSMVDGADSCGDRVTGAGDERITRFGSFLRRHKFDEYPQLLNVLKGEMSLVGPRPEVPEFVDHYPEEFERVLSVPPGITHRATQLFRQEEDILGAAADPRTFYVEKILPRKLAIYLRELGKDSLMDDLRTIFGTVFDSGTSFEIELLDGEVRREAAPMPPRIWVAAVGADGEPAELPRERTVPSSMP